MYNFIDVKEIAENTLPAEALQINGQYIEDLIAGYRTLSVTGREALSAELDAYETGVRDGATLKSRRYPARTIIVKYQLIAEDNAAFRAAYNKLGGILNVEEAKLIFNDENDKYYIGTPASIGEVEAGRNSVVGEFEIVCNDPFKYSVCEYEAVPVLDEGSVLIDYNGTYKAYPILEADFYSETDVTDMDTAGTLTGNGDCGYIAFFTEDEKIIQIGDPDEVDGEAVEKSQTMMNQTFLSNTAWGTTAKKLWAVNNAKIPADVKQEAGVEMAVATVAQTDSSKTSAHLGSWDSLAEKPFVGYSVTAEASDRTETAVKVTVAVTGWLGGSKAYFANNGILKASVYMGGAWHSVVLKSSGAAWYGESGHTVNMTFTVPGLTANQTALTGIKFKVERPDGIGRTGILGETVCNNLPISAYTEATPEEWYLKAADGYGSSTSGWHGSAITRTLGADAAGEVGAKDFTLTYRQKMCIANVSTGVNQKGGFHCHLYTNDGKHVAGVRIVKTAAGNQASLMYFVNGQKVEQYGIDLSYYNLNFGASSKSIRTSTIQKSGGKITFKIGTYAFVYTDDAVADLVTNKVTFMFERYGQTAALTYNGLHWAKLVKHNCNTFKNIPNKFSANDVVEAVCRTGEIFHNGIHSPELGALGNDWEGFVLTPGLNQIGVAYSDWCSVPPTLKVRYREVFL